MDSLIFNFWTNVYPMQLSRDVSPSAVKRCANETSQIKRDFLEESTSLKYVASKIALEMNQNADATITVIIPQMVYIRKILFNLTLNFN